MNLRLKKLHPGATMPTYQTDDAACFDLHTIEAGAVPHGGASTFRTGLAFEVPRGHVMLVFSRSGHGFTRALRLANATGVIDSDYRGEVKVRLHSDAPSPPLWAGRPLSPGSEEIIQQGDRVAQALVLPIERVSFEFAEDLTSTDRGERGFGSTGG